MKKIGITGKNGFLGYHLYHQIKYCYPEYKIIEFDRSFFKHAFLLDKFVADCDVIVHLAGINRLEDEKALYDINVSVTQNLVDSLKRTSSRAHVIFSSSLQENKENYYGLAKKKAREILHDWSKKADTLFSGLIIPNVFGPFGKPYYNSVVATFCHQLTHNESPKIQNDNEIQLIYVGDLVHEIMKCIIHSVNDPFYKIETKISRKVSEILKELKEFKETYFEKGEIPILKSNYEIQLFNTFRSYININSFYPKQLNCHLDDRGVFAEIIRHGISGQTSFSTTLKQITRGNHFHTRKTERFTVIKGEAIIQLRKIGSKEVLNFKLSGSKPAFVDMPIWYTHNITNTGEDELITVFWINEPYDPNNPDTYFEIV